MKEIQTRDETSIDSYSMHTKENDSTLDKHVHGLVCLALRNPS